jgi:hypothetical protein
MCLMYTRTESNRVNGAVLLHGTSPLQGVNRKLEWAMSMQADGDDQSAGLPKLSICMISSF